MGETAGCAICSAVSVEPVGVLCAGCARLLSGGARRAPGIVTSQTRADDATAWLIDAWGQLHAIGNRCTIGRDRASDLAIADLEVSSEHAELRRERGRWLVRDRGSANGTGLGGQPRTRTAELGHRQRIWFGAIAFYLWADPEPPARDVAPPDVRTLVPDGAAFHLTAEHRGELLVRAVQGHPLDTAPGALEYHPRDGAGVHRAALSRLQFQLLRVLCEAAVEALDERAACVRSHELLARLPFQTHRPEPNHVRQVVSTLRAALDRAGVPGGGNVGPDAVIDAVDGAGYRVTWRVRRAGKAR